RLILARDPVGKKPLYFAQVDDEFLFASEIKGVRRGLRAAPSLAGTALDAYLTWGCVPGPGTIYREIQTIQPGECVVVANRKVADRKRYWRQRFRPITPMTREQAVERTDVMVREAVRLRLRADVDVGCFLSGGIDSGLIVAMASSLYPGTLKTITVGFEDDAFDERSVAAEVANRYGTSHTEVMVRPDVAGDLPAIAQAYDQPYADSSAIPSYYVAKAAREQVKVVLNGDGGDEVFVGYRRYVAALYSDKVAGSDCPKMQSLWAGLASQLPASGGHRTPYAFFRRFARGMGRDRWHRYVSWALDGMDRSARRRWLARNGQAAAVEGFDPRGYLASLGLSFEPGAPFLRQMLAADFACVLPYDLLVKIDIACMAHGLEARSPLLDVRLVEAVAAFPERTKLSSRVTKPILRELARRYLPDHVCSARKQGFEVPLAKWLDGDLRALSEDVLLARSGLICDLFDRRAIESLLRAPDPMAPGGLERGRRARFIWILLMLGLWDQCVQRAD
ncbi:MAG: asparagine synthetase B family protein, partial [Phycisphaerae bacterium]